MQQPSKAPITNRFWLLSTLGALGTIAFLPSIVAESTSKPSAGLLAAFALIVTVICIAATWFGLRCADNVGLPMPYLRRLDHIDEAQRQHGLTVAIIFGVLFALASIALLKYLKLPNLAGQLWSRLLSTFFAAGSLELVVHLLLMSVVVKLTAGRRWTGIVAAAIAFVLFHVSGVVDQSTAVITLSVLMNGLFALGLGVIYARYGFEFALLCHATGHMLAVGFA